ncbi:MAG: sigma-70 family RNA polymerase sigma factor [Gammaproteobacteria bacterium]|nr:sigma-70 family RNA polymerase sigma factor [Gammaproteobacteria bacterium]MBU0772697.1 sigma-70 family RNA polymerase sigma factor [Gammaproteobacteria bacterium]MBU0857971.1 sigma-70 family RNA polymerase sigma factor [Gammaproteobacteria bacterium]MBU1846732.1 sigma-70 family RNA polymerase sigma factor [Gammaproteobacteria bacterium]
MPAVESAMQQQMHTLYSDHHGWLYGWLRKRLGCSHNAADVAHDTFVRIIASRDALIGPVPVMDEPRAYLATTANRLLVDRARRQSIERAYLAELALAAESEAGHPSAEDTLAALQALEQISVALDGVSARAREAFMLHYLDEQTHAAIADRLGVSSRMVRKYLVQCLLQCRAGASGCPAWTGGGR